MNNIVDMLNNPDCEIEQIIVNTNEYNYSNEKRLLIPFLNKWGRTGIMNNNGDVIFEPRYCSIHGNCYNDNDILIIGQNSQKGYVFAVIDYKGNWIIDMESGFREIYPSDDNKLFTVRDFNYFYGVVNSKGEEIVPLGTYHYIDIFYRGFARVKSGEKWGIINEKGEIKTPIEYDKIWNFKGKNCTVKAFKDGVSSDLYFPELDPELKNYGTPPKVVFRY